MLPWGLENITDTWSAAEVEAAVEAYADLFQRVASGEAVNKRAVYRALSEQYGRTLGAYERRFGNISHVLVGMGLPYLAGLRPAGNVGVTATGTIRAVVEARGYFREALTEPTADPVQLEQRTQALLRRGMAQPPAGNARPQRVPGTAEQFARSAAVRAWVLLQAAGHCECCRQPAPFATVDGQPYLEVHHVRWLALGGSDTITNAVALCPNCHRQFHYGADVAQLRTRIITQVPRLAAE